MHRWCYYRNGLPDGRNPLEQGYVTGYGEHTTVPAPQMVVWSAEQQRLPRMLRTAFCPAV